MTTQQKQPKLFLTGTVLIATPAIVALFALQNAIQTGSQFLYMVAGLFGIIALIAAVFFASKYKKVQRVERNV